MSVSVNGYGGNVRERRTKQSTFLVTGLRECPRISLLTIGRDKVRAREDIVNVHRRHSQGHVDSYIHMKKLGPLAMGVLGVAGQGR